MEEGKRGKGKRKKERGGTQRGEGEGEKEETKKEPTSRSYPAPPGGGETPAEQLTEVPPPRRSAAELGGTYVSCAQGPRRGGASPERDPENRAHPKERQC